MSFKQSLYKIPWLSDLIRSGLNRAAPHGLTQVKVAAGNAEGLVLALDMQNEKDYWLGTYEPELQQAITEMVLPGMVAYDLGANIGYISLLLARAVGSTGQVLAFEALPANIERLRTNIVLNNLEDTVTIIPKAVSNSSESVHFLVGPSGGTGKAAGSAGRQELLYAESITVQGVALDALVYDDGYPAPDIVKMDIEGGEVLALPGMRRVLTQAKPSMLMELHGPEAAKIAWAYLMECDYRIYSMSPGYPIFTSQDQLDWKAYVIARPQRQDTVTPDSI
jgi:FkbM family methyltransferase